MSWSWSEDSLEEPKAYFNPLEHEWVHEHPISVPLGSLNAFTDDAATRHSCGVTRHGKKGDPHWPRGRLESCDEHVAAIGSAMKNGHPLPPLLLEQTSTGFRVADGNHRVTAAKAAGLTHAPALVMRAKMAKAEPLLKARMIRLGPAVQKFISAAVDKMFDRIKAKFLGPGAAPVGGKALVFNFPASLTLTGLFEHASRLEGVRPREEVLRGRLRVAGGYLDAHRERTKAQVLQRVEAFLHDAQQAGVKTDVGTVLGGQLTEVWRDVTNDIRKVVETEATQTRNTSIYDAIGRIGASTGRSDPTVFFVVVRDNSLCGECRRLHLLDDGVTPRVYKMSELGAGYHKKGDATPKIGGLHPHCRCVLTHLLPGYGFDAAGRIMYRSQGWDEYREQRP